MVLLFANNTGAAARNPTPALPHRGRGLFRWMFGLFFSANDGTAFLLGMREPMRKIPPICPLPLWGRGGAPHEKDIRLFHGNPGWG